jgi:2-polyprenyl-6-methoxyphenol hydroxylase-like FAD-dependent oxidoreductase
VHPDLPAGLGQFAVGRGTQIGIFHCGPGRIYWFATQNGPAHSSEPPEGRKHEALAAFRGWFPLIPAVIESTPEAAILRGDICDRPPAWPWGAGRVTLLGDAIHPTTPNLGQGACQALEDAVQLAASLGRARDPLDGLRDYEQRRRARTAWVTKQSWSLGKVLQWQHPLAVWLRDRASRTRLGQRAAWRLFETLLSDDSPGEPDSHLNWS